jgi:hypothetical protein
MAQADSGAPGLAPLLDGSTAGVPIPELACHALQQLIKLEVAAVLGLTAMRAPRSTSKSPTTTVPAR